MKKSGFTLVELLIVIALIAILAVISILIINPQGLKNRAMDAVLTTHLEKMAYGAKSIMSSTEGQTYPSCAMMLTILINPTNNCATNSIRMPVGDLGMTNIAYQTTGAAACLSAPSFSDVTKSYLWCSTTGDVTLVPVSSDCSQSAFPC